MSEGGSAAGPGQGTGRVLALHEESRTMRNGRRRPALIAGSILTALVTAVLTSLASVPASSAAARSAPARAAGASQVGGPSYNGLAMTPPMGWDDWFQYRCGIDETIVLATARSLVSSGLARLGYKYVNLDDCWMASTRAADGQLQADPTRFPHGIKWLAGQVHAMGLKLGIYESVGTTTCEGLPGSFGTTSRTRTRSRAGESTTSSSTTAGAWKARTSRPTTRR